MIGRPVVWITRPQPGADRTAAILAGQRYDPFVLPLTEISSCDSGLAPDDCTAFDVVAATSANALRHAPTALIDALTCKPVYAVGDATAAEAEARGFSFVTSAEGSVDDLVALISNRATPGASVLYLCGRTRAGDLDVKLTEKGFQCRLAEVYAVKVVSYPTELLYYALNRRAPDAVLFHSALAARTFVETVQPFAPQSLEKTRFFAMSIRIAGALPAHLQANITVAAEPTEHALLAALRHAMPIARN